MEVAAIQKSFHQPPSYHTACTHSLRLRAQQYGSEILASIKPLAVDSSRRLDFSCVGPKAPLNGALREVPRNEVHRVRRRTKPVLELLDIRHNKAPCTGSGMVRRQTRSNRTKPAARP